MDEADGAWTPGAGAVGVAPCAPDGAPGRGDAEMEGIGADAAPLEDWA
mgnify:CR=1 FL=1